VVLVDIDEVKNHIHFAMTTAAQATSLTSAIRALGIPDAAVYVSHGHQASRDKSLSDQFRPVPGGVQIEPAGGGTCTLTVNVLVDNDDYFVANSHCSDRFGNGGDGSYMYQNTIGESKLIGQEVVDPDLIAPGVGDCPTWAWVVGNCGKLKPCLDPGDRLLTFGPRTMHREVVYAHPTPFDPDRYRTSRSGLRSID
jgi:hypothetical protein